METKEKTDTVIREVIITNNDRSEGYKTAAEEIKDMDLKELFNRLSEQSRGFNEELKQFVIDVDKLPKPGETKNTGKLYRVWMDVKAAITANNRKAVLSSCEFGEDTALKNYDEVLRDSEKVDPKAFEIIKKQREKIKQAHAEVKALLDAAKK